MQNLMQGFMVWQEGGYSVIAIGILKLWRWNLVFRVYMYVQVSSADFAKKNMVLAIHPLLV